MDEHDKIEAAYAKHLKQTMPDWVKRETDMFIRVYRLPAKLSDGFCFGGGVPIEFTNVDWFNGSAEMKRADVEAFVRGKKYCTPGHKWLVLSDTPEFTFQFST